VKRELVVLIELESMGSFREECSGNLDNADRNDDNGEFPIIVVGSSPISKKMSLDNEWPPI